MKTPENLFSGVRSSTQRFYTRLRSFVTRPSTKRNLNCQFESPKNLFGVVRAEIRKMQSLETFHAYEFFFVFVLIFALYWECSSVLLLPFQACFFIVTALDGLGNFIAVLLCGVHGPKDGAYPSFTWVRWSSCCILLCHQSSSTNLRW
jgi:hypothetical protein